VPVTDCFRGSVTQRSSVVTPWAPNKEGSGLCGLADRNGVTVTGRPTSAGSASRPGERPRFRGVSPTSPTITMKEVFRGHYAQARHADHVRRVITAAQNHWFHHGVGRTHVLTSSTEGSIASDHVAGWASPQQAEDIRRGALDMGVPRAPTP